MPRTPPPATASTPPYPGVILALDANAPDPASWRVYTVDHAEALDGWSIAVTVYAFLSPETPVEIRGFGGGLDANEQPVYPRRDVVLYLADLRAELGGLGLGELLSREEKSLIRGY